MNNQSDNQFLIKEEGPGLRVCSYRTSRFKTLRLSFNMALPLGPDAAEYAILPYLLSHSCKAYPDYIALSKRLAELYGASLTPGLSKLGENLVLSLGVTAIDSRFALEGEDMLRECAGLLGQVLFEPKLDDGTGDGQPDRFPEADLEREKRLMLERIDAEKNDKRVYALRRCTEIMCADEAYACSVYGTADGVRALTPERVFAAWQKAMQTAQIQIDIVGSTDPEPAKALLCTALHRFDRTHCMTVHTEVPERAESVRRAEEQLPVEQGKLVLGYRTGMKDAFADYPALRMMTDIFGGGTYSRLFMNVREKQSLCYYCSAHLRRMKGIVFVQSGVENENAETALTEIQKQLAGMAGGDVTDDDIQKSFRSLADGIGTVCDSPEELDGWAFSQMCDPVFESPEEITARLSAVTRSNVIEAAKKMTLDTVFLLSGKEDGNE